MVNTHKSVCKARWRSRGLILTSKEEFDEIYDRYMSSTHCEKCNKKYKSTKNRHMDHEHLIDNKWGAFRNVLCTSCNVKRCKIPSNNTSGYIGICKRINKRYKQGFIWSFRVSINGVLKFIKSSLDKEKLIKFAIQWKIDNHYVD